jgi:hypothetical protein
VIRDCAHDRLGQPGDKLNALAYARALCGTGRSPSGLISPLTSHSRAFPVPQSLYTPIEALHEYLNIILDDIIINKRLTGYGFADDRRELAQAAKVGFVVSGIETAQLS